MKPKESLRDYVRRVIAQKGLSHVKVAERARKLGHDLSPGTVNTVIQATVVSPKVSTLQALAAGLGEPEDDLFALARGKQPASTGEWASIESEYKHLSESDKKELRPVIEMLKQEIHRRLKTS